MPKGKVRVVKTIHKSIHLDDYNALAGWSSLMKWWKLQRGTDQTYRYPNDMKDFLEGALKSEEELE